MLEWPFLMAFMWLLTKGREQLAPAYVQPSVPQIQPTPPPGAIPVQAKGGGAWDVRTPLGTAHGQGGAQVQISPGLLGLLTHGPKIAPGGTSVPTSSLPPMPVWPIVPPVLVAPMGKPGPVLPYPGAGAWKSNAAYVGRYQSALTYLSQQENQPLWDPQGIDGKYGPHTDAAVRAYQASRVLTVDGMCGPATAAALDVDLAAH